jgi:hypothetical protein
VAPQAVAALHRYVAGGGLLLAGVPLANGPGNQVRPDAAALTGVERAESSDMNVVRTDVLGAPTRAFYTYWRLTGAQLEPQGSLWDTQTGAVLAGTPERVLHRLGQGRVLTLCGDIFEAYHQVPAPVLREMVLRALKQLGARPAVELDPAGQLEVSVRERAGDWFIHLVNRGADRDTSGNSFFVERVPEAAARVARIRYPGPVKSVTLEPGGRTVAWQQSSGAVQCELPSLGIHEVLHVQGFAA